MAEPKAAFAPEQSRLAAVAAVGQGRPTTESGVGGAVVDDDMLVEGECRMFVGCWATV
ncbi:hypothetical protein ACGFZA_13650 [Streptomyces sp. NPDC048211]|uniref:hypothetical protein n=1 Tax=Streptomyces sp. NPDC048211 TaxID=3365516 RepID=UPI0037207384